MDARALQDKSTRRPVAIEEEGETFEFVPTAYQDTKNPFFTTALREKTSSKGVAGE